MSVENGSRKGVVHKQCLQEEGGQKNQVFENFYTLENVNGGG